MLNRPGHSQAPLGKGPPSDARPSLENLSRFAHLAPSDAELISCGGMGGTTFGEPRAHSSNGASWAKTRPLSDIRELTEPSLADNVPKKLYSENSLPRSTSRAELSRISSVASRRPSIDTRYAENREPDRKTSIDSNGLGYVHRGRSSNRTPSPPSPAELSLSSIYSIPPSSVPPRSSSRPRAHSASRSRQAPISVTQRQLAPSSLNTTPCILPPPVRGARNTVPRRGHSQSPLRHIAARFEPISHETQRHIPSRTFIREPLSAELLEFPSYRHPRVHLGLDLSAGVFVGGGSIEGTVQINVDDAERIRHRKTLAIARISVDLLGLEEMSGSRRSVFLNLATELIDENNPPPHNMVDSQEQIGRDDPFWHLMPSITSLPFMMSLPLNVGPPPFQSKIARIRYILCVSLLIRDQGKQYIVRASDDISVLSVYDRMLNLAESTSATNHIVAEKALMSLPSPLTASDEWLKPRDASVEVVRVTAGLHRQVWVSGTSIYVDVHIANNGRKPIKRIELQLERDILCYKHVCSIECLQLTIAHANGAPYRLQPLLWKSQLAKLEYSIAMSGLYLAKRSLSKEQQAGMVFLPITHTFVPATLRCLEVTLR